MIHAADVSDKMPISLLIAPGVLDPYEIEYRPGASATLVNWGGELYIRNSDGSLCCNAPVTTVGSLRAHMAEKGAD